MLKASYIAGFFDGEGSIGIYKNGNGTFYLRTQLVQNKNNNSTLLLEELLFMFGGNLSESNTTHGIKYNWQLNSERAMNFLKYIQSDLILKKEQCDVALNWQQNKPKVERDSNGRYVSSYRPNDETVSLKLKQLKKDRN